MNLSELIRKYGDDRVALQKLDDCTSSLKKNSQGTTITFVTPESIGPRGLDRLGLVIWLDRARVAELVSAEKLQS